MNLARLRSFRAFSLQTRAFSVLKENVQDVKSQDDQLKITKLKKDDKSLMSLFQELRSKKEREMNLHMIVEGQTLIQEAMQAKIKLHKLIFSDTNKVFELPRNIKDKLKKVELIKVPVNEFTFLSVLETSPGLIAVFERPKVNLKKDALPIDVIIDNVRENNNCGSCIRVCNSIPVQRVLLLKGSVNPYDTKSIRGSAGSVFFMPLEYRLTWQEVHEKTTENDVVLIADNSTSKYDSSKIIDYDEIPDEFIQDKNISLIIGGETMGISKEALMYAKSRDYRVLNIPLDPTVNSLNISNALAVILFEIRRRVKKFSEAD